MRTYAERILIWNNVGPGFWPDYAVGCELMAALKLHDGLTSVGAEYAVYFGGLRLNTNSSSELFVVS